MTQLVGFGLARIKAEGTIMPIEGDVLDHLSRTKTRVHKYNRMSKSLKADINVTLRFSEQEIIKLQKQVHDQIARIRELSAKP